MRRKFYISFIAVLYIVTAAFAFGSNGTITGTLKDIVTGNVISGAKIADQNRGVAYTGSNGVFTLSEPAGSYTLTASATGYLTTYQITTVTAGVASTVNWALTKSYGTQTVPSNSYVVLAWNDLGMHCDQDDYSYFSALPPFNTLHVQVISHGQGVPVTSGITVSYTFPKKTNSTLHTNFWTYAAQFGWNVAPNVGITGTPLSGTMSLDANGKSFQAVGIPITPYDDDGTWDPYGTATITVRNTGGTLLQTANVVAPVSTEMTCSNCHGTTSLDSTMTPNMSILHQHDTLSGTTLVADYNVGKVHLCASCHQDNVLGTTGVAGVESMSLAMHNFHKDKMNFTPAATNTVPGCYNCHPGTKTQCMRGIMERAGKTCTDCHGDMYAVTSSLQSGRQAWLQEPKCGSCHDAKHAETANTLYRNSLLQNSPNSKMNSQIYCEGCHNSTHGEWTTNNAADNTLNQQFQGDNYWIWNCNVCHSAKSGQMHN